VSGFICREEIPFLDSLFGLPVIHCISTVLIHLLNIYSLLFIYFFKFDMLLFNIKVELQNKTKKILL